MNLKNYKISTKIFSIVGILGLVIISIVTMSVLDLQAMHKAVLQIEESGAEALLGARARQNALVLSRSEFRVASDPSAENINQVKKLWKRPTLNLKRE